VILFDPEIRPGLEDERRVTLPANIESKAALFAFLRHALSLPDYFGDNWDALEECLNDAGVMGPQKIVLIHGDVPLEKSPSDQRTYLQILAEAARHSTRFDIVFPERYREKVVKSIAAP
jgi:RNAse (barnase) inhibitor barstar